MAATSGLAVRMSWAASRPLVWSQSVGSEATISKSSPSASEEAGDPVLERRRAGDALEHGDGVAGLELLGHELAGELAAGQVVGGDERGLAVPAGDVVVDEDDLDAGVDRLLERVLDVRAGRA